MRWHRLTIVYAVLGLIIGSSLFDIITDDEHWPFSSYAMYSHVERERTLTALRWFGVSRESSAEIPLLDPAYIAPFDQSRLRIALSRLQARPEGEATLREALLDCLVRYERLRAAGRHAGPPLAGIRLYRLTWRLDPWARNVHAPDRRELLIEVTLRG